MLNIPVQEIRKKIQEQADITLKDIEKRVQEKMKQLAGLISEEGALHIIANELHVQLMPAPTERKVKDLMPGMQDIQQDLKIIQVYEIREWAKEGRSGKVGSFLGGDETGIVRVTLWGEKAESMKGLEKEDIVRVVHGYVKENNGRRELHVGTRGDLVKNPPGVTIEVNADADYVRKKISELSQGDYRVEILGTIVQVYDPRFFQKKDGSEGVVTNLLLDDGTGTLRCSCWGDVAAQLLGKKEQDLLLRKEASFEQEKMDALGNIIKVRGRAKLNTVYNNIELTVDELDLKPDANEELAAKQEKPRQEKLDKKVSAPPSDEEPVSIEDIEDVDISDI